MSPVLRAGSLCAFLGCWASGFPCVVPVAQRLGELSQERVHCNCMAGFKLNCLPTVSPILCSSCPLLCSGSGSGPTSHHGVAPVHPELPVPPAHCQPQAPLHGVPEAPPPAPSADHQWRPVPLASHPTHVSGIGRHASQCHCCQPQRGGWSGDRQWPVYIQPHQREMQARREEN